MTTEDCRSGEEAVSKGEGVGLQERGFSAILFALIGPGDQWLLRIFSWLLRLE